MTDAARHARWSVAALLAPATAAVFAGSVGWASAHSPDQSSSKKPTLTAEALAAPATQTAPDDGLDEAVKAQIAQVEALRKTVGDLRKQVAALDAGTTVKKAGSASKGSTSTTAKKSSTGASRQSSQQPAQQAQQPVQQQPVQQHPVQQPAQQQPAPATNTTTGGS